MLKATDDPPKSQASIILVAAITAAVTTLATKLAEKVVERVFPPKDKQ